MSDPTEIERLRARFELLCEDSDRQAQEAVEIESGLRAKLRAMRGELDQARAELAALKGSSPR